MCNDKNSRSVHIEQNAAATSGMSCGLIFNLVALGMGSVMSRSEGTAGRAVGVGICIAACCGLLNRIAKL